MTAAERAEERARTGQTGAPPPRPPNGANANGGPPPDLDDRDLNPDDIPPPPNDDIPPIGDEHVQGERKQGARDLARRYLVQHATHPDGVTLRRWRGDFYRWIVKRGSYVAQTEERIESELWNALPLGKGSELADVKRSVIAADGVLIDEAELGSWLDDGPDLDDDDTCGRLDTAACRNGLLHLPTGKLTPATPLYFATSSIGTFYDAHAPTPERWLAFLRQIWLNDPGSIRALQEWIGYLLTPDTRQHKIACLIGPKRSGKSTIGRVITALLGGRANVASPTLASLATNFGLWPLIGKTAAIIGDARLGGRSDVAQVVERLLNVSGEDPQTIDRKHREPWIGTLPTRITIISNETPRFTDASDALTARMIMFRLTESFYGQEDITLTNALLKELPGILVWAIDGWRSLRERGHFVQPDSGREALEEMADLASPVGAWARECCQIERGDEWAEFWLTPEIAYANYCRWIEAHGHAKPSMATFGRDVAAATCCPRTKVQRTDRTGQVTRPRVYKGLVLRTGADS